jgi:hypothetical protein
MHGKLFGIRDQSSPQRFIEGHEYNVSLKPKEYKGDLRKYSSVVKGRHRPEYIHRNARPGITIIGSKI